MVMKTRYAVTIGSAVVGALALASLVAPLRAGIDVPPFAVGVPFDPYTIVLPGAGGSLTSGSSQNTFGGVGAGGATTTNTYSTSWGFKAGSGGNNHAVTSIGAGAGAANNADDNSFFAADAGNNDDGTGLITGVDIFCAGVHSCGHMGSGGFNTATGNESMVGCGTWFGVPSCPLLAGGFNTADGAGTLANIQGAAYENFAGGYNAGAKLTEGCQNIFLGPYAGANSVTLGCLNILIGRDMRVPSDTGNGQLNIGNLITGTGLTQGGSYTNGTVTIYGSLTTQSTLTTNAAATINNAGSPTTIQDTANGIYLDITGSSYNTALEIANTATGGNSWTLSSTGNGHSLGNGLLAVYPSSAMSAPAAIFTPAGLTTPSYTVSTLPSGYKGVRAFVIDATSCSFLGALTGGGSTFCPVVYNGSAWVGG
jgi:hypothetical protein